MPVHTPAIACPEDLDLLRNIYQDICRERCIHEGSHASTEVARALMYLFSQGVLDEVGIRETMRIYFDRKRVLH
ncbi:MAG TPA: hypothetical protein VGV39_20040 [Mesorhizobium sp.]|jgi:hypothetical protein|uniref:hypothetical protein n=1 Tax=Mesorhizobium sp. TaxID=1871066 RepID=UPI002DDDB806|nr:hypothetical protein [Mesorhizobium sp.]HEV2505378.1 hypothetical protein [Mesorhizobium sp.]